MRQRQHRAIGNSRGAALRDSRSQLFLFLVALAALAALVYIVHYSSYGTASGAPANKAGNTSAANNCSKRIEVADFNGTAETPDYILSSTNATFTNSITISFWMLPARVGDGVSGSFYSEDIMDIDNRTGELPQIYLEWRGNGRLNLNICNTCTGTSTVEPTAAIGPANLSKGSEAWTNLNLSNEWVYVAISYNIGNYSFYANGDKVEAFGGSSAPMTDVKDALVYLSYYVPYSQNAVDTVFGGYMADVRLYNVSLSAKRVYALYGAGIDAVPANRSGLVAWWPLNGTANDYSGKKYDGTIYGNVVFVPQNGPGC